MKTSTIALAQRDAARAIEPTADRCPLCGAHAPMLLETVPVARIWKALEQDWRVALSDDVVRRHTPSQERFSLARCGVCDLHYFAPAIAGDSQFYRQLGASAAYYVGEKWEFRQVASLLDVGHSVLDIGCGSGAFLASIDCGNRRAVGIDVSETAVLEATRRGLDVRLSTIEAFARSDEKRFDVVCAFQILEHLSDTRSFVAAATSCLAPGGLLALSVPNRDRVCRAPFEPLDCPPHHVSRWAPRQLELVATFANLSLVRIEYECAPVHQLRLEMRRRAAARARRVPAYVRRGLDYGVRVAARIAFLQVLHRAYVRTGLLASLGLHGHAMLALYRKPGCEDMSTVQGTTRRAAPTPKGRTHVGR